MMLRVILKRALALVLALMICAAADILVPLGDANAASDGMIRVLLTRVGTGRTSIALKTTCEYAIGKPTGKTIPSGASVKLLLSEGKLHLSVNGETIGSGATVTLCRLSRGNEGARFTSPNLTNVYSGDLIFTASSEGILPVCRIYIENYLYGVVAYEMSNSFPIEALKAQAVCARTYAMRLKKSSGSYDVTDNTTHQVFKGYNSSYGNVIAAVDATKGQCLLSGGSYAGCWYTASNGGQTESTKNVWGGKVPYSTVKDDPYDLANPSSTAKRHSVPKDPDDGGLNSRLAALLREGYSSQMSRYGLSSSSSEIIIEAIASIDPHTPKYPAPSRTYTKLRFGCVVSSIDSDGERVTAPELLYLDLSTYDQLSQLLSLDIGSTSSETVYVEEDSDSFDIVFRRYGHGVGLSQRGAQQMAKQHGMSAAQILAFYFEGTSLVTKSLADTTAQGSSAGSVVEESEYGTLSYGDKGEDVKKLQQKLKELGYFDGTIGGNYLDKTTAAVRAYQADHGFEADGIATAKVQEAIFADTPSADAQPDPDEESDSSLPVNEDVRVQLPSSGALRVYSAPDASAAVRGTLKNDAVVRLLAVSGEWAAVSGEGLKGYCSGKYLAALNEEESAPAPEESPVPETGQPENENGLFVGGWGEIDIPEGSQLRVFRNPATNAERAGSLERGDIVRIYGLNSSWAAIKSVSGLKGYINQKYIVATGGVDSQPAPAPEEKPAPEITVQPENNGEETVWKAYAKVRLPSAGGKLGLREAPASEADCIAYLANGSKLKVYARIGDWVRVSNGEQAGYVPLKYLQIYE